MKILLFSSTNNPKNGYGNITHELCTFLSAHADVTLLLPKNESRREGLGYRVEYVLPPYIFDLKTPKILEYLRFSYDASRFDLVHSLFEFPYALLAARIAKRYRKPYIIGTQGTYAIQPLFWYPEKWLVKWAYGGARMITAPSTFTRDNIIKYSGTKTPVTIIHNGVNFSRFQRQMDISAVRAEYPGKKLLLTVGLLKPRKGQDLVIEALGLLKERRDDFHYLVVGKGRFVERLKALAQAKGIGDRVTFCGEIDGDKLIGYFQACDAYVHTPVLVNWQFEGFGIVYLEASACAKPIVAADSGGIRDAVIEGQTGLIVPEGDVTAIAQAIERILDNPELAQRLGHQGHEYARRHDWAAIGQQFLELYQQSL